jgi:hypothetical protein
MEGAAAGRGQAAHIADQALPHALLIRDGRLAKPECILFARLALRRRWLSLCRKGEETERKGNQSKLCHQGLRDWLSEGGKP